MLSRRELLRHLGGVAGHVGIASVALACGGKSKRDVRTATVDAESLRTRLLELADELERRYPVASILGVRRASLVAGKDAADVGLHHLTAQSLVVQVFDGASWQTHASDDLTIAGAERLANPLLSTRSPLRAAARKTRDALRETLKNRAGSTDLTTEDANIRALTEELYDRASSIGSSRTIYRGTSSRIDLEERLFIGSGKNVRQLVRRQRSDVSFVARSDQGIVGHDASTGGSGPTLRVLGDDELRSASNKSLAIVGGDVTPTKDIDLVLAPALVASLVAAIAESLFDSRHWLAQGAALRDLAGDQVADRRFSLTDDATTEGGYASLDLDDEGTKTAALPLISSGILVGPYNDRLSAATLSMARTGSARLRADGVTRGALSNLVVTGGDKSTQALIGDVTMGYQVEGLTLLSINPRRRQIAIRARRAREIQRGSLTGRIVGPLFVRAETLGLLLAIRGVSSERQVFLRDGDVPVSITAPTILTRAEIGR